MDVREVVVGQVDREEADAAAGGKIQGSERRVVGAAEEVKVEAPTGAVEVVEEASVRRSPAPIHPVDLVQSSPGNPYRALLTPPRPRSDAYLAQSLLLPAASAGPFATHRRPIMGKDDFDR